METKTFKIRTCMRGFKKWMDAHPCKKLNGYFSVDGRDMTDAEVRRVVLYAVEKGYETDIKVSEILKLTTEKPIFGHISGKRANTHWLCFMKGGAE